MYFISRQVCKLWKLEVEGGGEALKKSFVNKKLAGSRMSCDHKAERVEKGSFRRGAIKELISLIRLETGLLHMASVIPAAQLPQFAKFP